MCLGDGARMSSVRNNTTEMDAQYYPGSGPSWRGKTPTSCFGGLYCLERLQVTELEELEVATMAIALDLFFLKE